MRCEVRDDGHLENCAILEETPKGQGYGRAALKAAQYFKMRTTMPDGRPAPKVVIIPMRWLLPGEPTPTASGSNPPALAPPRIGLSEPIWDRAPRGDDLAKLYPPKALAEGTSGRVIMRCHVTLEGALAGCAVVSETPRGYGFGEATLETAKLFRLDRRLLNGLPQRDRDVPLKWQPPK